MNVFKKCAPPIIDMGGLACFETACRIPAPTFIEQLIQAGTEHPKDPLGPDVVSRLVDLIAHCLGDCRASRRRAVRLVKKSPDLVALALRGFLEDPLPVQQSQRKSKVKSAQSDVADLPSVLDMRAAWLAAGGDLAVFERLTLWEHTRILQQQEHRQRVALADAAVAARVAQAKDDKFRKFVAEMQGTGRAMTPRDWVQHLFKATAHLPKVTQQELSMMKGRA